jgi:hypothetical protein
MGWFLMNTLHLVFVKRTDRTYNMLLKILHFALYTRIFGLLFLVNNYDFGMSSKI